MEGYGEYYSHTLLIMEDDLHDTDETGDMIAETETAGATCTTTAVPVSSAEPIPSPGSPLVDWCTCGLCRPMPQVIENKCCKQAKCITTTSHFAKLCLDPDALEMAEFILEDGKVVTDGIPSDRKPSDINLRTENRLMQ